MICSSTFPTLLGTLLTNPSVEVPLILKGYVAITYWRDYAITRTQGGLDFFKRWTNQVYTGPVIDKSTNKTICNRRLDDEGQSFLYQNTNGSICTGLNFSTYSVNGKRMNQFAASTYDAVLSLGYAVNAVILNGKKVTSKSINVALKQNVTFNGASGLVTFWSGGTTGLATGGNAFGYFVKLLNYHPPNTTNPNDLGSFVQVSMWNALTRIKPCPSDTTCYDPIYRTADNTLPHDTRKPIYITMNATLNLLMFVISSVILLIVIVFSSILYYYRRTKLVKASQPMMNLFIMIGVLFGALKIMIVGFPITDSTCVLGLWAGHLAYVCTFGALFLKTYRVHVLMNNVALKRVKFSTTKVLLIMGSLILFAIFWLLLLTFGGKPHRSYVSSESNNQSTNLVRCSYVQWQITTVIFCLEAILMAYGGYLIYAIRNVPNVLNESKNIATGKC